MSQISCTAFTFRCMSVLALMCLVCDFASVSLLHSSVVVSQLKMHRFNCFAGLEQINLSCSSSDLSVCDVPPHEKGLMCNRSEQEGLS